MAEFNNRSVYKNGKGCRNIPLITLLQKFLYIMALLKEYIKETLRECYESCILDDKVEHFKKLGIYNEHGYWSIKVNKTQVGLHALYWI
jgi:hypothetical protein